MTVNEALAAAGELIGANADNKRLIGWLYEIENMVCREIAATHQTDHSFDVSPITPETDGDRILFVPDPESQLYILYIVMKNDLYLRDTQQYLNSASIFASAYASFADRYNREYLPNPQNNIKL